MKEVGGISGHKAGGSWSARAKRREKVGESSSIGGSRFSLLDSSTSLESSTPVKRKQVDSAITPKSCGSVSSEIDEIEVEAGK